MATNNPYIDLLRDDAATSAQGAVARVADRDPDAEAQLQALATRYDLPVDAVRTRRPQVEKQLQIDSIDYKSLAIDNPATTSFLGSKASIARDDVPVLQQIENRFKAFGALAKSSAEGFASGVLGLAQAANQWDQSLGIYGKTVDEREVALKTMAARGQMAEASRKSMPVTSSSVEAGINSGIVSTFTQLPLIVGGVLTRNPGLALGGMSAIVAGQEYGKARDANVAPGRAAVYAGAQGGIEALTEMIPMNKLVGDIAADTGLGKTLWNQLIREIPGEQVATLLQDANEQATLHPDKTLGEFLRERPDAALQTLIATAVGTGAITTTTYGADKVAHAMATHEQRKAQAQRATAISEGLQELHKFAKASKVRERDAASFEAFVATAAEDGAVTDVYVPAAALAQMQANETVMSVLPPAVQEQLQEAVESGGYVKVPVAQWAVFAGSEEGGKLAQELLPHLKIDPADMSTAEAEEYMQSEGPRLEAEMERVLTEKAVDDDFKASSEKVRGYFTEQLNAAKRFTPDTNDAYATIPTAFYTVQAARLGITPEEMLQRYPLRITSEGAMGEGLDQFAGPNAIGFPVEALQRAKVMETETEEDGFRRYGPKEIHAETGWQKGDDGKWRFEISDDQAKLTAEGPSLLFAALDARTEQGIPAVNLGEVVDHPALFKAYPALANIPVVLDDKRQGGAAVKRFRDGSSAIVLGSGLLSSPDQARSVLLHEIQHLIQNVEGFASGANSTIAGLRAGGYGDVLDSEVDEAMARGYSGDREQAEATFARSIYERSAGEIEARNTQSRADMTDEERAATSPIFTRDTPQNRSIIRFSDADVQRFNQSAYDPGLGFKSKLADAIDNGPGKASGDQWVATLQNTPGVKKEELEWTGVLDYARAMGEQGPVTKEMLQTFIAENGVQLEEIQKGLEEGADSSENYVIEEREEEDEEGDFTTYYDVSNRNTGEVLETFTSDWRAEEWVAMGDYTEGEDAPKFGSYRLPGGDNYREVLMLLPGPQGSGEEGSTGAANPKPEKEFRGGHWDEPNVLAHMRLTDRQDADGNKILFIEEIQSDWHQKGREEGYAIAATPEQQEAVDAKLWDAQAEWNKKFDELRVDNEAAIRERVNALQAKVDEAKAAYDRAHAEWENYMPLDDSSVSWTPEQRREREIERSRLYDHRLSLQSRWGILDRNAQNLFQDFHYVYTSTSNPPMRDQSDSMYRLLQGISPEGAQELQQIKLRNIELEGEARRTRGEVGIPDAPFKSSWTALAMRRVIQLAVEGDYQRVAWIHGDQQNGGTTDQVEGIELVYDHILVGKTNEIIRNLGDGDAKLKVKDIPIQFERDTDGQGYSLQRQMPNDNTAYDMEQLTAAVAEAQQALNALPKDVDKKEKAQAESRLNLAKARVARLNRRTIPVEENEAIEAEHMRALEAASDARSVYDRAMKAAAVAEQAWIDAGRKGDNGTLDAMNAAREEREKHAREWNKALDVVNQIEVRSKQMPHQGFEITDKMREAVDEGFSLFQEARGRYTPSTATITVLRTADLSTVLHELGHHFLEVHADMASRADAPPEVVADFLTTLKFMGYDDTVTAADWRALPLNERREGHEKFARGFEAYLFEGKSPSVEMRGVFQRFRAWLLNVYRQLAALDVKLTREVRGVFDRLLATNDEIIEAQREAQFQALFANAAEAGMTEEQFREYQALGADATQAAVDRLQTRSLRDMKWLSNAKARKIRELQREAAAKRIAVRNEVTAEVMAEPVNMARQFLRRGLIDGQEVEGAHKLSIEEVELLYGKRDYSVLGYGKYGMLVRADHELAINPEQAAELFGYGSGDEMILDLLTAEDAKEKIAGLTDQRMLERYGDLTDAKAIAEAADEAIHNDARLKFVAAEYNALAEAVGQRKLLVPAARNFAAGMVARLRVREVRPSRYTSAERRAARAADAHAKGGRIAEAAVEKRNQLINGLATRAAYDAQAEIEKALRYFAKFSREGTRKAIDVDYRDQIDQLLERYDLRTGQSLKAIDKRKSLAAWIEGQREMGFDPTIDEALLDSRQHYKDMTVEELRGLRDAIRNIEHLGRLKHRLLTAKDKREFDIIVGEMADIISTNAPGGSRVKLETNTKLDRLEKGAREFLAHHRKFASLIRQMGGFKDGGLLWETLVRPMNAAANAEAVMLADASKNLNELFKPLLSGSTTRKTFIPEIGQSLSLEGRLLVALNWGNEANRQRVADGDGWDDTQINAILGTLTAEQWASVQGIWDYIDTYWEKIAAKERRVTGSVPERVERSPFSVTTADGQTVDMAGGYFPIKYDRERSPDTRANELAEQVRQTLQGAYTRATTRRGHTKARAEKVELPVSKSFSTIFQHVNQVVHDLAWHEYLIDANRLLKAKPVALAINTHYGPETLDTLKATLTDVAIGNAPAQNAAEGALNYLRTGASVAGLGWNLMTGLLQPLGLTQSVVRIGPKWVGKGLVHWMGDWARMEGGVKKAAEISDFMRTRHLTMNRELHEIRSRIDKGEIRTNVEASFFVLIQKLQLIADMPTFWGGYEKALAEGNDEATAVALADQAVIDAQGGGTIKDLSQVQRGHPAMKLWTTFYSFFNVTYNLAAESVGRTRKEGVSTLPLLAGEMALLFFVPSMISTLMRQALQGDDDDDWEKLPKTLALDSLSYLMGTMLLVREVGGALATTFDYTGPGGTRGFSDFSKLAKQAKQGEVDEPFLRALNATAGVLLHYPSGQLDRTVRGFMALKDGKTQNPLVLFVGPRKESR